MKDPSHITNTDPLAFKREEGGSADLRNQTTRRTFLQAAGLGAAALAAHGVAYGAEKVVDKDGKPIQGFEDITKGECGNVQGLETRFGSKDTCGYCGLWLLQVRGGFWIPGSPQCRSGGGKRSIS